MLSYNVTSILMNTVSKATYI